MLGWVVVAVLLVGSQVMANAVLDAEGVVRWVYAVVAVVAAGCWIAVDRWFFAAPGLRLRLREGRWGAPAFGQVAMADLGVHRSRLVCAAGETYVKRDIDAEVRAAVATGPGLVLVHGPRLAGATRTLVEAVRQERPGVRLVAFEPTLRRAWLSELSTPDGFGVRMTTVVWRCGLTGWVDRNCLRSRPGCSTALHVTVCTCSPRLSPRTSRLCRGPGLRIRGWL